jgi:signal transduction histidine kinase
MDLNKGKIEVESELGVGTTFILKFIKRTSEGEESLC